MITDKFYITENENELVASTPENECWICDSLSNGIRINQKGLYLTKKLIVDNGIVDHLKQIIKREIAFISS